MSEIESYGGAGSAADRVREFFGKQTEGASIPPDVLNDIDSLHQSIAMNAGAHYQNRLRVINQNYGSAFQPVNLSGDSGGGGQLSPAAQAFISKYSR